MRRFLLVTLLAAGAGCQGLRERCGDEGCGLREKGLFHKRSLHGLASHDCEPKPPCAPVKKETSPPRAPERPAAAPPVEAPAPVVAQDILLVPKTVYVPYAAQTPTVPLRLTSAPPPAAAPPPTAPPPTAPAPTAPAPTAPAPPEQIPTPKLQAAPPKEAPCDVTLQMLEICKKLNARLDCLEKKQAERNSCPPALAPCAPAAPLIQLPLFRRPLFGRCDPLQLCEPCPAPPCPQPRSAPIVPTPPAVVNE